ncbi:MAG TPA: alpha-amylase family glycosyl hydrolase, partial [Chlamydiales bacterium]|nr:alpha-amylase family glycosyl hydrolase [Chlamydiales bacterium]
TKDASSGVQHPGTYHGAIEKIPHLQQLGVTAVELMPIQEFDETEYVRINPKTGEKLYNFWGYSPLSFFAPMQRYAASSDSVNEFKQMIKAFHKAGIQVILDMVFNHTGEGNEEGRILSWKGFGQKSYYILDAQGKHCNYSGCGNTLNCNEPLVQDMIIASLQHWCSEYHIDGFRFDLASILARGPTGKPLAEPPLLERITHDPLLKDCILIAEPWDAAGLHQVGSFYKKTWKETSRWIEWNDDFRTVVRRFIKGDYNMSGRFATKLSGSQDIYAHGGSPLNSMNYITAHDGFTLHDLVSYNNKHNFENGEDNRDGMNHNDSWNCGIEGETKVQKILSLRKRQMKNYLLALFLAQGIPMLLMGDEYGHTKHGNNNTWCHDNQLNWFLWDEACENEWLQTFIQELIHLRKAIPQISREQFLKKEDVEWHGTTPHHPDWSEANRLVAYTLKDHATHKDVYIAFNASDETIELTFPEALGGKSWQLTLTTDTTNHKHAIHKKMNLHAHSAIVLLAL